MLSNFEMKIETSKKIRNYPGLLWITLKKNIFSQKKFIYFKVNAISMSKKNLSKTSDINIYNNIKREAKIQI